MKNTQNTKHMKTLIAILATVAALVAPAQIVPIDQTTLHTNYVQSGPARIWITATNNTTVGGTNVSLLVVSNASYTAVNSNSVSTGDSPVVAWGKANTNFAFLDWQSKSNAAYVTANCPQFSAQIVALYTNLFLNQSTNLLGFYAATDYLLVTNNNGSGYSPLDLWYRVGSLSGTNFTPGGGNWYDWTNGGASSAVCEYALVGDP